MKSKKTILISFFFLFLYNPGFGQNWEWEWSEQNTQKDAASWSFIMDVDFQNNIYTGTQFGDSLFIGDSIFAHENYYDWASWAIAKYDNRGRFQNAFDITAMPGRLIFGVELATDKNMNLYIACEFQQWAHLLDTTIYNENVQQPEAPQVFLAKISPTMNIEWVRLITSPSQNKCNGLAISSDNNIYMATKHHGNGSSIDTINYFNQDTAIHEFSLGSLLKIDFDGNLVWRKELSSHGAGFDVRELNTNLSNVIILNGHTRDTLYYSNDTLLHPHPGENMHRPFIAKIDSSGELISGLITDWSMVLADTDIDDYGNLQFAGFVWDTAYFASDTIIQHEDTTVNILARLDANYEPIWYETTKAKSAYGSFYFYIDTYLDTMFFAGRCRGIFSMFDTIFNVGAAYESFVGQVTPNGELENFTISSSTSGFMPNGLKLDNCNNLMVSGRFKGHAYLGQDTLASYTTNEWDGLLTKITRYSPNDFSFGPDTIVCDGITLFGSEGYQYYYWNDSLTDQNWLNVTESGEYIFACTSDEGCWIKDTINIFVQSGFSIDIGQDTLIGLQDTLHLSVPDIYDSYLWSTGSTENETSITGSSLGPGNWDVWLETIQGACTATDTIHLTVIDAIPELEEMGVMIFPNPVEDFLYINSEKEITSLEIYDSNGRTIRKEENQGQSEKLLKIDLSNLQAGIYFIRVQIDGLIGNGKIIKL